MLPIKEVIMMMTVAKTQGPALYNHGDIEPIFWKSNLLQRNLDHQWLLVILPLIHCQLKFAWRPMQKIHLSSAPKAIGPVRHRNVAHDDDNDDNTEPQGNDAHVPRYPDSRVFLQQPIAKNFQTPSPTFTS